MTKYIEKGLDVIRKLKASGHDAYLVGPIVYSEVANFIPGVIGIVTTAFPDAAKEILGIKEEDSYLDNNGDCVFFFYEDTIIAVETLKGPLIEAKKIPSYVLNRKQTNHEGYNITDSMHNVDFTVNAVLMRVDGEMVNNYHGVEDINNKIIRIIDSPKRFINEPILILKAIYLAGRANFKIERKTFKGMKKAVKHLKNLSKKEIHEITVDIIGTDYTKNAYKYINKLNIFRYIPVLGTELKVYREHKRSLKKGEYTVDTFIECALVKSKKFDPEIAELSKNPIKIKDVFELAMGSKKCKYNPLILYTKGLEIADDANKVNYLLGKCHRQRKKIIKMYESLPIKKPCDLEFKKVNVISMAGGQNDEVIDSIFDGMVYKVLYRELENQFDILKAYVINELVLAGRFITDDHTKIDNETEIEEQITEEPVNTSAPQSMEIPVESYRGPVQSLIRETVRDIVREAAGAMPIYNPQRVVYVTDPRLEEERLNRPPYTYQYNEDVKMLPRDVESTVVEGNDNQNHALPSPSQVNTPVQPPASSSPQPVNTQVTPSTVAPVTVTPVVHEQVTPQPATNVQEPSRVAPGLPPVNPRRIYQEPSRAPLKPVVRAKPVSEDSSAPISSQTKITTPEEQIAKDYRDMKLYQYQRETVQNERTIKEQEEEIKRLNLETLRSEFDQKVREKVAQNMALLSDQAIPQSELANIEKKFTEIYRKMIIESDPRFLVFKEENK